MKHIKLLLISGPKADRQQECPAWNLEDEGPYTIGCGRKKGEAQIRLPAGHGTATLHARFFSREGRWWLESLGKNETRLNGRLLTSGRPGALKEYDCLCLGSQTYLVVLAPGKSCFLFNRLCFVPEVSEVLNYALLCSGLPFLQRITIFNGSKSTTRSFTLELNLGQTYQESAPVKALAPGESLVLKDFQLHPEVFAHPGDNLTFRMGWGKETIFSQVIRKMSFNTWLKDPHPATCTSLAAFVLPKHSYVIRVTDKIRRGVLPASPCGQTAGVSPQQVLESLYNYFRDNWQIRFNEEPFCNEYNSQKVRLPQHILYDWDHKHGEGNCLDLSLLFCSCLENWGCEAMVVLLELGPELWHALVGVLPEQVAESSAPLVKARDLLPPDILLLDPNGLSSRLDFAAAASQAQEYYAAHTLLFALHIRSARDYGIDPMPFEGAPKESPLVIELDIKARELAETVNPAYRVCTTLHMLLALLQEGAGVTEQVFDQAGVNSAKAAVHFIEGLRNIEVHQPVEKLAFSRNYALVMPRAALLAREAHSPFIMEEHLLLALLEIPGESLNIALQELGLDCQGLKVRLTSLIDQIPASNDQFAKSVYNNKKRRVFFF